MIESILQRQLAPIVARLKAIRRRRSRTIVFAVIAFLAWLGGLAARDAEGTSLSWLWLPVIGGPVSYTHLRAHET